jgi:t-SNARE complex subunit (syntaxin)
VTVGAGAAPACVGAGSAWEKAVKNARAARIKTLRSALGVGFMEIGV